MLILFHGDGKNGEMRGRNLLFCRVGFFRKLSDDNPLTVVGSTLGGHRSGDGMQDRVAKSPKSSFMTWLKAIILGTTHKC